MATFVLVHGAWMGGWAWARVRNALREAGHNVFAPTLTGLGERVHLSHPEIDLNTHIEDVVKVIEYEDLHRIVLVGHSYGGMVISGVAERVPQRLSHLVYLDAMIPKHGESAANLLDAEMVATLTAKAQDSWRIPMAFPLETLGITSEGDMRWVNHRFTPQPLKTVTTPIKLSNPAAAALPRTFIHCTRPAFPLADAFAQRAKAAGFKFLELPTGHAAPVTAPKELATLLQKFVPALAAPSD